MGDETVSRGQPFAEVGDCSHTGNLKCLHTMRKKKRGGASLLNTP